MLRDRLDLFLHVEMRRRHGAGAALGLAFYG